MKIKGIIEEDFVNYKVPSMLICMPYCSFKCDLENGTQLCHNWHLSKQPNLEVSMKKLIDRYLDNEITKAIIFLGLEPMDSSEEVISFIELFRKRSQDDIVIYSGYTEEEMKKELDVLKQFDNIIVKFGRYRPNQEKHFDEELGVCLANDEQYAVRL